MIDKTLEHFLLYDMSDDWMPAGEFASYIRQITPGDYSRAAVLEVIAELATKGYLEYGGWSRDTGTWKPWKVAGDVALERIANGFDGEPGVLDGTDRQLALTEVFRAGITPAGERLVQELGNPFELYGDPWEANPLVRAEGEFPPWQP
ncbi:hypothetical protein [Rhodococcoides yunnanense]|uniref:hypothetical protein n=1 Tax=Rhodococcoides yunnanense TaxID=278209 RepID=UPI000932ED26|nr:hypothetical protein [Rhodococcus yunnanensis]